MMESNRAVGSYVNRVIRESLSEEVTLKLIPGEWEGASLAKKEE